MDQDTRAQKEMAITMVSLAMWGAVVMFVVMAVLFYLDIIPSGNGGLIALVLLAVAAFDVVLVKVVVKKMQAELDA